jgi:hypothetical protein
MPLLGKILKKVIELSDQLLEEPDPVIAQQKTLARLLNKAKDTAFGKFYDFEGILHANDPSALFKQKIPYHSYDALKDRWWYRTIEGVPDITWPGKVHFFAVSSGTTGNKKLIPVTDDMVDAIRQAGLKQIKALADFDLPEEFFEKEILMFGSSTSLRKSEGRLEGEISGISASQLPFWFEGFYRPGKEIAAMLDWDQRVEAVARASSNWDIGAISGIPSWIELMLKKVIAHHQVKTIHDVWPNFTVFTSGGVAFEPYRKSFEKLTSRPIEIIDTYFASEGYMATQMRKEAAGMKLITDGGIYFEFVPFEAQYLEQDGSVTANAPSLHIGQVQEGEEYILIISTVSGAWRYMLGDTIRIVDKARAEIKITGRTKHYLNVVGSQLTVAQMNTAMQMLEDEFSIDIQEYSVAAIKFDDEYTHRWYLGIEGAIPQEIKLMEEKLDQLLKKLNPNYGLARNKELKAIDIRPMPVEVFHRYTEITKQKGGQVKVPRVLKAEDLKHWEDFLKEISSAL